MRVKRGVKRRVSASRDSTSPRDYRLLCARYRLLRVRTPIRSTLSAASDEPVSDRYRGKRNGSINDTYYVNRAANRAARSPDNPRPPLAPTPRVGSFLLSSPLHPPSPTRPAEPGHFPSLVAL